MTRLSRQICCPLQCLCGMPWGPLGFMTMCCLFPALFGTLSISCLLQQYINVGMKPHIYVMDQIWAMLCDIVYREKDQVDNVLETIKQPFRTKGWHPTSLLSISSLKMMGLPAYLPP